MSVTAAKERLLNAEAEEVEMRLAQKRSQADLAGVYNFVGSVTEKAAKDCIEALDSWSRRDPGLDMTIVLNTPGGDVIDGLALYDFIVTDLREVRGHSVNTVTRGYAASMGGILLQAGDERLIGANAHLLIHEVSRSAGLEKLAELEDVVEFSKRLQNRLVAILAERSTMSIKEIKRKWTRHDWWLSAEETVEFGFADAIG